MATLPVPEGSARFDEAVNTTLKPSRLVGLLREIVTGNVAVAWIVESTLEGAPTLTVACARALPANTRAPATAARQVRAKLRQRSAIPAGMRNPPAMRRRGDAAAIHAVRSSRGLWA